jgi:G3E family GTPase
MTDTKPMIRLIPFTGFLGSGKTTTAIAAATALQERGHRVAVITNDQGTDLVDTELARTELESVAEVTGGCFCCRFDELVDRITKLTDDDQVDTVIAEAVGSCTDLQATVVRPLRALYGDRFTVAPLTTVVDPARWRAFQQARAQDGHESDLSYLFFRQLAEADVIACNKADTLTSSARAELEDGLRESHPDSSVLTYSALTGDRLAELVTTWQRLPGSGRTVDVDYDRYAAAEAALAWLNQTVTVTAADGAFDADAWAHAVLTQLSTWCAEQAAVMGHAKIVVTAAEGIAKLSVTQHGEPPRADRSIGSATATATAAVNARIACAPQDLDAAITRAMRHADESTGAVSTAGPSTAFAPAYPQPVHRM